MDAYVPGIKPSMVVGDRKALPGKRARRNVKSESLIFKRPSCGGSSCCTAPTAAAEPTAAAPETTTEPTAAAPAIAAAPTAAPPAIAAEPTSAATEEKYSPLGSEVEIVFGDHNGEDDDEDLDGEALSQPVSVADVESALFSDRDGDGDANSAAFWEDALGEHAMLYKRGPDNKIVVQGGMPVLDEAAVGSSAAEGCPGVVGGPSPSNAGAAPTSEPSVSQPRTGGGAHPGSANDAPYAPLPERAIGDMAEPLCLHCFTPVEVLDKGTRIQSKKEKRICVQKVQQSLRGPSPCVRYVADPRVLAAHHRRTT